MSVLRRTGASPSSGVSPKTPPKSAVNKSVINKSATKVTTAKGASPKRPVRKTPPLLQFTQAVARVTGGTILGVTMLASSVIAGGLVGLAISFRNLPDVRVLRNYVPVETSYIYDINGKLLSSMHGEANRENMPLNQISPNLKLAVLAIEDSHFYSHSGVNPIGIMRALVANLQAGKTVEGGSTITMQLVKNLFLTPERALSRKVAEAVLAMRLEQVFTKDQIFEMYMNQVYWGHNTYGAETAAESYFGKSSANLTLGEAAMMAGLVQAPESFSPFVSNKKVKKTFRCIDKDAPELACERQLLVLNRMLELEWITDKELQAARNQTIKLGNITSFRGSAFPQITNAVVQELTRKFGQEEMLKGGMRVQTTIDTELQLTAQETVKRGHANLIAQGVYADQMALVAVDPRTHYVKAMVGSVDPKKTQFNRAIQALRQPGSAFKPFVYYTAFATGKYDVNSIVMDTPVSYNDGYEQYAPQNYDGSFSGAISIRQALAVSRNVPAVRLGQEVGINRVIEVCRILGIKSPMDPVISLPLGAVDLTPLEMASAYATFANNGWQSDTTLIVQVTDSRGNILWDNTPKPQLVLDPWATASLTDALQSVITNGTATVAQIGRPAAGKTGTTSSERDIWFVGYVPQLAVAVWVGNDDYTPIGHGVTGGGYVAPIWRDFMLQALKNVPVEKFRSPSEFDRP